MVSRFPYIGCNAGAEPVIPPLRRADRRKQETFELTTGGFKTLAGGRQYTGWTKFADFCVSHAHNGRCDMLWTVPPLFVEQEVAGFQ